MRRAFALGFVYFLYVACAASPSITAEPQPPVPVSASASPAPPAPIASAPREVVSARPAGSASAAPKGTAKPPEAPKTANKSSADQDDSACPEGMQLVEGEYCTKVEHKCVKEWHDKANDKDICEEFEPHSTCVGTSKARLPGSDRSPA